MHNNHVQEELYKAYVAWKTSLHLQENDLLQLSPPLLLSVSESYLSSKRRILLVGQETYGWDWTSDLRIRFPKYQNEYLFENIVQLKDFIEYDQSIEALIWGYKEFYFASYQPKTYNSPFWRAFRDVQKWPDSGLIWNNLSRCDYQSGSILKAPLGLQDLLIESQRDLFNKELMTLQPTICIFFTGPDYDGLLSQVFPEVQYMPVGNIPVRQLARIHDPRLPACSFRTYHPNYLSRGQHWDFLDKIQEIVIAET